MSIYFSHGEKTTTIFIYIIIIMPCDHLEPMVEGRTTFRCLLLHWIIMKAVNSVSAPMLNSWRDKLQQMHILRLA